MPNADPDRRKPILVDDAGCPAVLRPCEWCREGYVNDAGHCSSVWCPASVVSVWKRAYVAKYGGGGVV